MNTITKFAFGAVAAAVFALPLEAQIWKRGDVVTQSGDRVIRRSDGRIVNGVTCVDVQLDRYGSRRTEQVCDFDRDGVYGDTDDRRIEAQRREAARRNGGMYGVSRDRIYNGVVYRTPGEARAAEVRDRNEARRRQHEIEKRQRELERDREKLMRERDREREKELKEQRKELEKRQKELEKEQRKARKGGRWL